VPTIASSFLRESILNFLAAKPLTSVENHFLIRADTTSAFTTRFGPQRVRFCFDAQHGSHATGKHAETIRHILDPRWHSSFWPNRYISPESAVAHPELPRRTVVMLMEPARSA
jgi:hypothetical protein